MRQIRKLFFQDAAGNRYGLNGERGAYAASLAGFGFTLSPSFADLSRGFFVPVSDETEPQSTVTFTMVFTRSPYTSYTELVNWLAAAGTVTIVYNPTGAQEYYRDVIINYLQKGELNEVGWLESPGSLYACTPWYKPVPTSLTLEGSGIDESKRYTYRYTKALIYGADSTSNLSGTIVGAGHIPGSLTMIFTGGITNPKIRLVGNISGKTYGICSVTAVLSVSDALLFSTRYEDSYVKKRSAAGVETDLLDVLDLSSTPFFHIPVDEPCTISVESDAAINGKADLEIYYYYRSV